MRFIVALSPIQKIAEASLLDDLMDYAIANLTAQQSGFIKGFSTQSNIEDFLKLYNKGLKTVLFVDFS